MSGACDWCMSCRLRRSTPFRVSLLGVLILASAFLAEVSR